MSVSCVRIYLRTINTALPVQPGVENNKEAVHREDSMIKRMTNTAGLTRRVRTAEGQSGFTLVEVMITVAIVGIVAAIAVPLYLGQMEKSVKTAAIQNIQAMQLLMEHVKSENGCYFSSCAISTDQVLTNKAIMSLLPTYQPSKNDGQKYNYSVRVSGNGTRYVVGAALVPNNVSAGTNCAPGELKINQDNNKCGI
jgi:type IV pilus assembly protein PilE